eukprot:5558450-Prymnesium_polylepis.1
MSPPRPRAACWSGCSSKSRTRRMITPAGSLDGSDLRRAHESRSVCVAARTCRGTRSRGVRDAAGTLCAQVARPSLVDNRLCAGRRAGRNARNGQRRLCGGERAKAPTRLVRGACLSRGRPPPRAVGEVFILYGGRRARSNTSLGHICADEMPSCT